MLFLFLFLISSTLRRGDDPYSILGVSRDATAQQIRTAFRKIAFDHHPDRHKGDEDSYMIWLRANDAYDILSNPQRKLKYDQDGTVSESDSNDYQSQQQQNTAGFYGNYGYRSSSTYSSSTPSYHTPLMTEQLFPYLARDGNEWILFAFQHFDCPNCHDQQQIWEKFAYDIKDYVKVGRLDVTQAPNLADELFITKVPQFLTVKMVNKSKYEVHKLGTQFSTQEQLMGALFKYWKASVVHFSLKSSSPSSFSSLNEWISNKHQSKVHVVEVRTEIEKSETVHFKYAASKLRHSCVFASVTVKSDEVVKSHWNVSFKKLPIVLVFRSNDLNLKPIVVDSNGRRILDEIDELSSPLFPQITASSINRICEDWCIVHIDSFNGSLNSSFVESAYNMPFNTGRLSRNSKLFSAFVRNERSSFEWLVISMNKRKFWFVDFAKIHDFVSLCSNLYRADDVDDVMKKKRSYVVKSLPVDFRDVKDFVFDKLNSFGDDDLVMNFLVSFFVVVLIILILRFICKPKSNKSQNQNEKSLKSETKLNVVNSDEMQVKNNEIKNVEKGEEEEKETKNGN